MQRNDVSFGDGLRGQLDRIDALLTWRGFHSVTPEFSSLLNDSDGQMDAMRKLVADGGRAADPRVYLALAVMASRRVHDDGVVVYGMLEKNSHKVEGRPWYILRAKIVEIQEQGDLTVGRIEMDPAGGTLFFGARFSTPFISGDHVDVVGYFAGDYSYENIAGRKTSLPAFAVAGMFKPNTVVALNRIAKFWNGDIGVNTLRAQPRKF